LNETSLLSQAEYRRQQRKKKLFRKKILSVIVLLIAYSSVFWECRFSPLGIHIFLPFFSFM